MRPAGRARLAALVLLVAGALAASARAQDLAVIELQHRRAAELLPAVQPLLDPGGAISALDDTLLVRTTPANLAQIRTAVAALDRPARQLLITVAQGTATGLDTSSARGTATLRGGDVQVGINRPPGTESGATVVVRDASRQADRRNESSVRTLEGSETYIAIGQSVPVTTTQVVPAPGWGSTVQRSTSYRDVSTGFYATARVAGDLVTLEISPRQQDLGPGSGAPVHSRGLDSVVTGRLGEWIPLGAVRETSADSSGGLLVWGRHTGRAEYEAWVKVDELR